MQIRVGRASQRAPSALGGCQLPFLRMGTLSPEGGLPVQDRSSSQPGSPQSQEKPVAVGQPGARQGPAGALSPELVWEGPACARAGAASLGGDGRSALGFSPFPVAVLTARPLESLEAKLSLHLESGEGELGVRYKDPTWMWLQAAVGTDCTRPFSRLPGPLPGHKQVFGRLCPGVIVRGGSPRDRIGAHCLSRSHVWLPFLAV